MAEGKNALTRPPGPNSLMHDPGANVLVARENVVRDAGVNVTTNGNGATPGGAGWSHEIAVVHDRYTTITLTFRAMLPDITKQERYEAKYRRHLDEKLRGAALPRLAAYRKCLGQTSEVPPAIEALQNDLAINELSDKLARRQLAGAALAQRLVELDQQRKGLEQQLQVLEKGKGLFAKTQAEARDAAHAEILALAQQADAEARKDVPADLQQVKDKLVALIEPHLAELRRLDFEVRFASGGAMALMGHRVEPPYVHDIVHGRGEWGNVSTDPEPVYAGPAAPAAPACATPPATADHTEPAPQNSETAVTRAGRGRPKKGQG